MSRALLVCLALALAAASEVQDATGDNKIRCSSIKPLAELTITQLHGDWIALSQLIIEDGDAPISDEEMILYSAECVEAKIFENSTESLLTLALDFRRNSSTVESYETEYRVSEQEKGRWSEIQDPGQVKVDEYLVISALPSKYLVLVTCAEVEPQDIMSRDHYVDGVFVFSRFTPLLGHPLVSERDYQLILEQTAPALGLKFLSPRILETGCFSDE